MSARPGTPQELLETRGWLPVGSLKNLDGDPIAWMYEHPQLPDYEVQLNTALHPIEPGRFVHTVASPGRLSRFEIGSGEAADVGAYLDHFRASLPRVSG